MRSFTSYNGKPVAINVLNVTSVRPNPHGDGCYINLVNGFVKVRDHFDEVVSRIDIELRMRAS